MDDAATAGGPRPAGDAPALPGALLCLITDESQPPARVSEVVEASCRAGCRWVQLRHRRLADGELLRLTRALRRICDNNRARLVVNDRADIALAAGADGLHLPAAGITASVARGLLPSAAWIGRSTHGAGEISALAAEPLDYFQFGPIFETASKAPFGPPQGLDRLRAAARAAGSRPLVAVGGIDAARAPAALDAGAAAVAVIGAICRAEDPAAATAELLRALSRGGPGSVRHC